VSQVETGMRKCEKMSADKDGDMVVSEERVAIDRFDTASRLRSRVCYCC
jgi:hypothetical protein